eukprot:1420920-Amphidinium_carterae.7
MDGKGEQGQLGATTIAHMCGALLQVHGHEVPGELVAIMRRWTKRMCGVNVGKGVVNGVGWHESVESRTWWRRNTLAKPCARVARIVGKCEVKGGYGQWFVERKGSGRKGKESRPPDSLRSWPGLDRSPPKVGGRAK